LQTTLLGLGLALIAAILAAFAAPFFIDWNEWRPQLEAQASALAGTRVTISGNIDLTLLPTPAFVLRDVSLGDASSGTGMVAREMRGSLSLPALLSGKVEASEFVVSRPVIRLVIEKNGKLLLPEGAGAGQEISVSGFVVEAGSLTIEDRRTNSIFSADDFSARGELVSREGPFRVDGGFRLNGMRWILRASSGRFTSEHSSRVRLALERPADSIFFEAEGLLAIADAAPRFEGKMIAAQRSGTLPWRISSDVAGDVSELRLSSLELALGQNELPITLSGEAKLSPRANGSLEATLASKRIDLDLGDQKAATTGAAHVMPILSEARRLLASLPLASQIALSADGVLAGGQLAREVRVNLRTRNSNVALDRLEARLPGRAAVTLTGKTERDVFSGPLSFESEEPQIFARWLLGEEAAAKFSLSQTLRVKGELSFAPSLTSIRNLDAALGAAIITGAIGLRPGADAKPPVAELKLALKNAELDALIPFVQNVSSFGKEIDIVAELSATGVRLFEKPVRQAAVTVKRTGGDLRIERFELNDFDGVTLTAKQRQDVTEFTAEIVRHGGFARLLERLSGSEDFALIVGKYAASYFPLRLSGTFTPIKNGWRVQANSGDAALALDLGELRNARQPIDAVLRLPETEIVAKGEFRFGADGRFEPVLALTLKSKDLRKAFAMADRAVPDVLPASGSASILREGNNLVFEKLAFDLAGSRGTGRLLFPAGEISPFGGQLTLDRANAATLLSLAIGRANEATQELSVPVLSNFPGMLRMEVGALELSERLAVQKAAFDLRVGRYETVFDNLRGDLANGKIAGSLRFADTYPRVAEIKLDVTDASLATLLSTKALRGTLRSSLTLSANGNYQDALLASISGQGTITLSALEIDQTDATSVSTVFAATAKETPDEKKIEQSLIASLYRAPLKVSKLEAPLVIANGILRSGSAKAKAGNIEILLSGSLNIPKRSAEALLSIEVAGNSQVRPGAVIRWAGPFDALERKVDAKALITAITLRAIERGGQNPSNMNLPQEDRVVPPVQKKRAPAKSDIESAPLLPPPANIPPVPQPRSQN
jgi:hypothetical protein